MEPIDIDELRARVVQARQEQGLSLRAAAEQAEVPFNTLSRVEKGHLPDLANFTRIVIWLGLEPGIFFTGPRRQRQPNTPERIKHSLLSDPHLTEGAAAQIAALVQNLYEKLATPVGDAEVHLRAHSTFIPDAARQLGILIEHMQNRLLADPSLGDTPGWDD